MSLIPTDRKWSTLALLSVGVGFGAFGYLAGVQTRPFGKITTPGRSAAVASAVMPGESRPLPSLPFTPDPSERWQQAASAPRTPVREKEMLALLEELGASDHLRAFALAASEPNWRLSALLRDAALRGWATVAPDEAASYALRLPIHERREAIAAVFQGAANQPELATALAAGICSQDPILAEDYGRALIEALSSVGAFEALARFSLADTTGHSADWLNATFYQWAERQPVAAQRALDALPTPAARQAAFQGLALGWSLANPRELAAFASSLPPGEQRSLAMQQALAPWMLRDPDAVASWVNRFDPGPEFDLSAATISTSPKFAQQQPAAALGWAQSILEPTLRESTLTTLARQWATRDRTTARQLIEQTTGLSPDDRRVLLAGLDTSAQYGP